LLYIVSKLSGVFIIAIEMCGTGSVRNAIGCIDTDEIVFADRMVEF